jgi:hypothetical protein
MRTIRLLPLAAALCLAAGAAQAQPSASPPAAGTAAAPPGCPAGSGPHCTRAGQGAGKGMAMGKGTGMRAGPGMTMGWSMMTPQERQAHQARMMGFTSAKECRAYVAEHHKLMAERAKQRGVAMPATPPHDPCAGLKD